MSVLFAARHCPGSAGHCLGSVEYCLGRKLIQSFVTDASAGFVSALIQQPDERTPVISAEPGLGEKHRERVKSTFRIVHGGIQVPGRVLLAVQEEIPDAQMALLSQEAQAVICAGIPLGGEVPLLIPDRKSVV